MQNGHFHARWFCWHAVELISIQIFIDHKFHQLIKCNPAELTNAQFSNSNANIKWGSH